MREDPCMVLRYFLVGRSERSLLLLWFVSVFNFDKHERSSAAVYNRPLLEGTSNWLRHAARHRKL